MVQPRLMLSSPKRSEKYRGSLPGQLVQDQRFHPLKIAIPLTSIRFSRSIGSKTLPQSLSKDSESSETCPLNTILLGNNSICRLNVISRPLLSSRIKDSSCMQNSGADHLEQKKSEEDDKHWKFDLTAMSSLSLSHTLTHSLIHTHTHTHTHTVLRPSFV